MGAAGGEMDAAGFNMTIHPISPAMNIDVLGELGIIRCA